MKEGVQAGKVKERGKLWCRQCLAKVTRGRVIYELVFNQATSRTHGLFFLANESKPTKDRKCRGGKNKNVLAALICGSRACFRPSMRSFCQSLPIWEERVSKYQTQMFRFIEQNV